MNPSRPLKREMVEELQKEQPSALIELVMGMQEALEEMRQEVGRLQRRVSELEEQNRPPSAPFRRAERERVKEPGKPGRKPGHPGACRAIPDHIDEEIEVGLWACPHCGGAVEDVEPLIQYLEELPVLRAHVSKLRTYQGYCTRCGKTVRSTHPRQMSVAAGAAAVQLGARAVAAAAQLKHGIGLTLRKSCRVLELLCGLRTTAGGLAQAFQRAGQKLQADYEQLGREMAASPVVHTDETSWWVAGPQSLWVFAREGENPATLYRVVARRDRSTFHETIPADFAGVLVSDCLSVYDGATALQHKCYAHHLRAWRRAQENLNYKQDTGWLTQVRALLDAAMKLRRSPDLSDEHREQRRRGLQLAAQALLAQPRADPAEESLRARLWKQRDHLLVFLDHPGVDPTNNLAERQLRPAIIARKLSCGNKTFAGAKAWQILASFAVTCSQRSRCFLDFLALRLPLAG